jgi:hypothetical protein
MPRTALARLQAADDRRAAGVPGNRERPERCRRRHRTPKRIVAGPSATDVAAGIEAGPVVRAEPPPVAPDSTARSFADAEPPRDRLAPPSQELEPPTNPGRFNAASDRGHRHCDERFISALPPPMRIAPNVKFIPPVLDRTNPASNWHPRLLPTQALSRSHDRNRPPRPCASCASAESWPKGTR